MPSIDIQSVEKIIRDVAAEEILPFFRHGDALDVAHKKDNSVVTNADRNAEKVLGARLRSLLQGSHVVGEEAFEEDPSIFSSFLKDDPVWILDPIDGTSNFALGRPNFAVMAALAIKDQIVAGWIYHPLSDEFFTAEQGGGAYHKGEKLKALPPVPLDRMRGMFYEKSVLKAGRAGALKLHLEKPLFACSHEYARLSTGHPHFGKDTPQLHFYGMGPYATPWDIAAGALIHAEAGGYSAFWNGERFHPSAFPSMMKTPFLSAPDAEAWTLLQQTLSPFISP